MKYFNVLILVVAVTVAHKSLANELKATQQRLSETYRYDFMDVREQYQLTRFNLRGIKSLDDNHVSGLSGVNFLREFPALGQETVLFQLSEISTIHRQNQVHEQYATTYLGIPVRGSDIRIHRTRSGLLNSINGQSVAIDPLLTRFASQWGSEAELTGSRVSEQQLLAYASSELDIPTTYMSVKRSQIEWVNEAPNLRQSMDITVGGSNLRVLLEFDAITGALLKVDNRVHLHQPVDEMEGYQ